MTVLKKSQHSLLLAENENKKLSAAKEYMLERLEEMKKTHDSMVEYFENTIDELAKKKIFFSFLYLNLSKKYFSKHLNTL